jgi:sugar lactone lactonase YvrE
MTQRRRRLSAAVAAALGLALIGVATNAIAESRSPRFPTTIALPTGFQPEGITIGSAPTAYFGSLADGDLYRVNLMTGRGEVFSQGPGTPSVGLKIDRRHRLFVAGGSGGDARVVDARTGEIIRTYSFVEPPAATFINDVTLTADGAYFTDSFNAVLYHLPISRSGRLPSDADVRQIPLSGDYQHQPGFNANGIVPTPDGKALIIVQSGTGLLFRVDPVTGVTTQVDLGGSTVTAGDGLLLVGRTLYVVRNQLNLVVAIRLNHSGTTGAIVDEITHPDFDVPTTVAAFGNQLYLPNARFGVADPSTASYTAVAVGQR